MCAAPRSSWDWLQLASLGEQLRSEDSLTAQHDRIVSMTSRLLEGKVDVWLQEQIFRLPDWDNTQLFPAHPTLEGMKQAVKAGQLITKNGKTKTNASRSTFMAVPLEDQGITLGALQITRPKGPKFSDDEQNLILGIAQIVSVSLFASHRAVVEQFRLRQLNLVREVSSQIANVLDLDELSRRVTQLIQKTFNFYYVAIFTLEPNFNSLIFRSSAVAPRKGRAKASIALEVEIGQGLIGEAAQCGGEIICDDVQADPRYRFIDSLPETRSEVVIPLKIEDHLLGVLDVQSNQLKAFHPNDLLILRALADNIARAVESARLYSDLSRRADQLTLVSEVSKSVTSTLDLSEMMRDAVALINEKFGYPHVSLFTVHPNRRLIMYEAGSGKRSKKLEGFTISLDDEKGIMPWVARNGKTVLANDVAKDERYIPSPLPPKNTKSELCVPLVFNERVLGLLDIQSDELNAFTEDDKVMFEAVADTMAAAIRNADLYRSEQWRRQVADSLREVAGLVSSNAGLDEVLDLILVELDRNLPVDVSAIWLLQDGELCLSAVHGIDGGVLENTCLVNPDSTYIMAEALEMNNPLVRLPQDPMGPAGLAAGFEKNYSSIVAPLRVGDRPLGLMTLAHHASGRYGHEAKAIAGTFANYAAVAIENTRLFDTAQEQAYASAALLQVAQAVVSLNDLEEILGSIIRIMPILVGVKRVTLYRYDMERETLEASQEYGLSDEDESIMTDKVVTRGAFPFLDHALEQNTLVTHLLQPGAAPKSWLEIQPEAWSEADIMAAERLLIAVPLSIKSDIFGILLIEEGDNARRFRGRRIEIIHGIAQQAALAIQNDVLQQEMVLRERLETEVQLARQIQQTFIPSILPTHPNWQIAARWRTARQVGGDFYDLIELPGNKLGIFIADVADKGMPAALFMALTRTLVHAAVLETKSPSDALRRVNDLLLPDTQQGMFVTAVYGELDMDAGTFTYVNAGHNPPFWVKGSGELEKLTRTGIALGAVGNPNITQQTIYLKQGDTLLLYTDGLTEAFSP
ncbi:MAG TPA: GAF domain-containing protein, partial [Anaerolineales bacterium]|nr:GAF domain-containing protein [Anaerolineales bacterium]HNC07530.1 GAF domain-containing protein [Anaerolineales bacterium]